MTFLLLSAAVDEVAKEVMISINLLNLEDCADPSIMALCLHVRIHSYNFVSGTLGLTRCLAAKIRILWSMHGEED